MIRNILLDLDNTILDFSRSEREALKKTLTQLDIEPTDSVLCRYSEINAAQWKLLELGQFTLPQIKARRYQLLFDELGVVCSAELATSIYEDFICNEGWLTDGAEDVLKALYPNYRVYIASNGTPRAQRNRIAKAGIEQYLSGVFISQEIGAFKPHIEFFDYCFAHIDDFRREETVMVGDSLSSDIKGGIAAGITTIWLNPGRSVCPPEAVPDYEIHALSELPELLMKL